MKRYIKNKSYNTDTAQSMGTYQDDSLNNLGWIEETLYLKKTGEFFLHAAGGAATKYAERIGSNSWASGSCIIPLTFQEAKKWAEEKLTTDEYNAIFGEIVDTDTSITTISIRKSTAAKLRRLSAERNTALIDLIDEIVRSL